MDGEGDIIYESMNISYDGSNEEFWGTHSGLDYKGLFNYYIKVRNTDGNTFEINGSACSFICEEGFPPENIENCAFGTQHNGLGELDWFINHLEEECF